MKKLIVILMAGSFLFTGCSKEDLTPVSNGVVPAAQKMGYYTITNNETDWGIVEYRVEYTNCNGEWQSVPLIMGESITVCILDGSVKTNFSYSIAPADNTKPGVKVNI